MSLHRLSLTDESSPLVEIMAWCRQGANLDLDQCSRNYMSPYGDYDYETRIMNMKFFMEDIAHIVDRPFWKKNSRFKCETLKKLCNRRRSPRQTTCHHSWSLWAQQSYRLAIYCLSLIPMIEANTKAECYWCNLTTPSLSRVSLWICLVPLVHHSTMHALSLTIFSNFYVI